MFLHHFMANVHQLLWFFMAKQSFGVFTEQQGHSRGVLKHCRGDTLSSYSRLFQVYTLPGIPGICNLIFKMRSS